MQSVSPRRFSERVFVRQKKQAGGVWVEVALLTTKSTSCVVSTFHLWKGTRSPRFVRYKKKDEYSGLVAWIAKEGYHEIASHDDLPDAEIPTHAYSLAIDREVPGFVQSEESVLFRALERGEVRLLALGEGVPLLYVRGRPSTIVGAPLDVFLHVALSYLDHVLPKETVLLFWRTSDAWEGDRLVLLDIWQYAGCSLLRAWTATRRFGMCRSLVQSFESGDPTNDMVDLLLPVAPHARLQGRLRPVFLFEEPDPLTIPSEEEWPLREASAYPAFCLYASLSAWIGKRSVFDSVGFFRF